MAYEELGISLGFGSPNLSVEAETALKKLAETTRQYRNVNFVFGEGQSTSCSSSERVSPPWTDSTC